MARGDWQEVTTQNYHTAIAKTGYPGRLQEGCVRPWPGVAYHSDVPVMVTAEIQPVSIGYPERRILSQSRSLLRQHHSRSLSLPDSPTTDKGFAGCASAFEKEGLIMASREPVTDRILGTVRLTPECDLDTLASNLPELTWNQVFLEIDRLSRSGQIMVTFGSGGRYMIRLPERQQDSTVRHRQS